MLRKVAERFSIVAVLWAMVETQRRPTVDNPTRRDVDQWRMRAPELRALAEQFRRSEDREALEGIATTYDSIADDVERRSK